jgi:hypothetical protein
MLPVPLKDEATFNEILIAFITPDAPEADPAFTVDEAPAINHGFAEDESSVLNI